MAKTRLKWVGQDLDHRDIEKYFEFYDLSLRKYYTDVVDAIVKPKSIEGKVLDIGCGFCILGMMLCARDEFSTVAGLEASRILVRASEVITARRGYAGRITVRLWEENSLAFNDGEFDAVVSFLSLHKWDEPEKVFSEIERVRKPGGIVYISDFRRDQRALPYHMFVQQTRFEMGKEIAADLKSSFMASYTPSELTDILRRSTLSNYTL